MERGNPFLQVLVRGPQSRISGSEHVHVLGVCIVRGACRGCIRDKDAGAGGIKPANVEMKVEIKARGKAKTSGRWAVTQGDGTERRRRMNSRGMRARGRRARANGCISLPSLPKNSGHRKKYVGIWRGDKHQGISTFGIAGRGEPYARRFFSAIIRWCLS